MSMCGSGGGAHSANHGGSGGGGGGGGNSAIGGSEVKYVNNAQQHSYYNLKNQHLVEDNHPPPLPDLNGSEICVTNDGYSYVDEIHTTTSKSSARSRVGQPGGNSSNQKASSGSSSGLYHHYYQNHRVRRTQPRITHNEKRYHSGQDQCQGITARDPRNISHECLCIPLDSPFYFN